MKTVTLKEMKLVNCGCFHTLDVEFNPTGITIISGKNGCGKTTIADAFSWLFTDRLMNGNSADMRPHDADGNALNSDDIFVVAYMTVDDAEYIFEKQVHKGFKGNETVYSVNGVQKRTQDFRASIEDIFGVTWEQFGYCISAAHFLKNDTSLRRSILFDLVDLDDDSKVAADREEYAELVPKLEIADPDEIIADCRIALNGKGKTNKGLNGRLDDLRSRLSEMTIAFEHIPSHKYINDRIDELSALTKSAVNELVETEKILDITKDFKRYKAELATERVNKLFTVAEFVFTELKNNGSVMDICDVRYKGERYSKRLNSGSRVLMDCDIATGFQRAYGLALPLFVDNAESATQDTVELIKGMSDQSIALFAYDCELTIE